MLTPVLTPEQRLDAAVRAPLGGALLRADSRLIERPGWHELVTPSAPGTMMNEVMSSQVDEADAERVIDEVIARRRAEGRGVKWCVGPWTRPADMGERLARRGFTGWDVRGMGRGAAAPLPLAPGPVTVREVGDADLDLFVATATRGWGLPAEQVPHEARALRAALAARPRVGHLFAAFVGDACVGTAALVLRDRYAYLLASQVLEAARGQGAYRALVATRLAFLHARGVTFAVTQAREATSAPILERLGFETLFRSRCWLLEPP